MNKLKLAKQAQKLYEIENLNAQEIADRIGVSRRTVFNWISRFNWRKHKIDLKEIQRTFSIELQDMVVKMMNKVSNDIDSGRKLSTEELYTIANIAQHLDKIEKQNSKPKILPEPIQNTPKGLTEDAIRQIRHDILGLDD